jgi:hypothetical protein
LIENLAVSGSASPAAGVDDKERQWKNDFMPADQINISLLMRNFGKEKKQKDWLKDDQKVDLRTFGVLGAIMSMKKTEMEKANREVQKLNLSKINTEVTGETFDIMGSPLIFPYLLDQTMVKNLGDLFNSVNDVTKEGNTNSFSDFLASYATTVVTAFAPNHLNTFTKFFREFESSYKATPDEKASSSLLELTGTTLKNRLKEKVPFYFDDNYIYQYDITGIPRRQAPKTLDSVFEIFGVDVPTREGRGIEKDGGAFEYAKQINQKINSSKELSWKDVIYLTFAYGNVKEVIPPDVPKTIENELFKVSLSKEEMDEFRLRRNTLREKIVIETLKGENSIFKELLDVNGQYNIKEDGTRITTGDKNQLLGYYLAGQLMAKLYNAVDNTIKKTLGPVIVNKRFSDLTPEEKAVIDKIKKENVYGELIDGFYNNEEIIKSLLQEVQRDFNLQQETETEEEPMSDRETYSDVLE